MNPLPDSKGNGGALVEARGLSKRFPLRTGVLGRREWRTAVDDVSFAIAPGRTVALVGESGSGKSTVGLMVLGLLEPTGGDVLFEGEPVAGRRGADAKTLRRRMQVVFQDPFASLNARMTVAESVTEGMRIHGLNGDEAGRRAAAQALLEQVGLPAHALDRYPHEFSGGQRQRIAIARALSVEPRFLLLDEPTSALDVSVQSQVLNLLRRLQRERGLAFLFVTHNLAVVEYLADTVCVMEAGRIVERGDVAELFDAPSTETTRRLLDAIPSLDPSARRLRA